MNRDKRKHLRRHFHYRAQVDCCDGTPVRDCLISDISESGARLTIEAPESLAHQFALLLADGGKARRWCSVAWRSDTQIGVRFMPAPTTKSASQEVAKLDARADTN
jgi:hypothetical protein